MEANKLDCCVVRDLLPAYVEELTEAETAEQVRRHLADCAACREVEAHMRAGVPLRQTPGGRWDFCGGSGAPDCWPLCSRS